MGVVRGDHLGGVGEGAKAVGMCGHERHYATSALEFKPRGDVDQDDRRPRRPGCQQMRAEHGHAPKGCTYDGRGDIRAEVLTHGEQIGRESLEVVPAGGVPVAVAVTAGVVGDDCVSACVEATR